MKQDSNGYADTVASLRKQLYLPQAGPTTGWLEEWMSPDYLGETTHRHLSPLFGLCSGAPGKSVTLKGFAG